MATVGHRLISLRHFQSSVSDKVPKFEEDFIPEGWSRDQVDLDCSEFKQKSQKEVIDDVIDKIIHEEAEMGIKQESFNGADNVERAKRECQIDPKPCKLRSYEMYKNRTAQDIKSTRSHKQINYIASMMKEPTHAPEERTIGPNEVIITVALYHPSKLLKQQEFQVLGSQSLTALRDRLYCLADYLMDGQQTKSGFFLIENTFYNDMRLPENMDYSKFISDWVNDKSRFTIPSVGMFSSKRMEDTTFLDLTIKIGQPYLYVHQGSCEHNIVFTEARLATPMDVQTYSSYPRHIFQAKIRRRKCKICDIFPARYVTYQDRMATEDPFFFCEHCYRPLHYDFEGRVLYNDFEVFPYYHE
ncbi:putative snRNA-activating protein complex subunit 3-like protein [Monocercomonoides exilis]|uniref:putative snRNA-activating protein complex subunit 3-like protein n=1 Tax=Monocercomonoides exilis TaxID=2049356 RepID=UPI003559ADF9|nr:putative snRNA-activating protein complex subunit 3-like protein [Monocercomonoides exilis]|eukprot:MONOS_12986.1-p1 / transcript=MONOS_12986.1 / gene=MONOS_12986 / organism=Monocercomonoides_exilis_PA203 / gene_product=snRNA-activating protein complex subunit 3-like protein / transcript_product=snRNA-activating protein complex subunit 3-like protein / location=Mono_scaffold00763:10245-11775(-) / protein_length=357 / sequence_SO=supercontig / SO=protein_coding / is_pseudo=false